MRRTRPQHFDGNLCLDDAFTPSCRRPSPQPSPPRGEGAPLRGIQLSCSERGSPTAFGKGNGWPESGRRPVFGTLALFLVVLVTAGACRERAAPPPTQESLEVKRRPLVAVLYTLDAEGEQLRNWATVHGDTVVAGRKIASGWLGLPLVLAATGIGMANAAATTQYVIDTYNPTAIIFIGIAGAINPDYNTGDIVIPDRWITHDFGSWGEDGFRTTPVPVGQTDSAGFVRVQELPADTALHRQLAWAARSIAIRFQSVDRRLPDVHIGGVGVSGDGLVDSKSKRRQLRADFEAEIVDRESAAVVQTALANGVPTVVMRACSDPAHSSKTAGTELEDLNAAAIYNAALVVRQFLEWEG